jgi:hypothetical protein
VTRLGQVARPRRPVMGCACSAWPVRASWGMGTGLCAAVDVHYLRSGGARAAAVLAADTAFEHVLAELKGLPAIRTGCRVASELSGW